MHSKSHAAVNMDQPIGSAIDLGVDAIACITFQIQFLGRQITILIDHKPEKQGIYIFPWIPIPRFLLEIHRFSSDLFVHKTLII